MEEATTLSEREADIMRQVVTGASNREIAKALDISPNTVKVHLRNIYEKLGVASRTEATLVVLRNGLVEVEGVVPVEESGDVAEAQDPDTPLPAPEDARRFQPHISNDGATAMLDRPGQLLTTAPRENSSHFQSVAAGQGSVIHVPNWLALLLGLAVVFLVALVGVLLIRPDAPAEPAPLVAETQRWQQLAQLPSPRAATSAVTVGRDLLVAGGLGVDGPTDDVWRYDTSAGYWEEGASLPVPVSEAPAASIGGEIFVVGGNDAEGQPVADVQMYDPEIDRWTLLPAELPRPLARAALAAFEGDLYLFGGWDGSSVQDTIYQYQPEAEAWEAIGALPSARADVAAAAVQDGIVLVGGVDEQGNAMADVLHFDPRADPPLRAETPLPEPASAPELVSLGNALYLLVEDALLVRDPSHQWQVVQLPTTLRLSGGALAAFDPHIYILGGEDEGGPVTEVWQYQALYRSFIPVIPGGN